MAYNPSSLRSFPILGLGKYIYLVGFGLPQWAVVAVCATVAGIAKVAFGVGAGVFLTPILALVIEPKAAVGLMWPVMLVTDVSALQHHWGKWNRRCLTVLLPTVCLGIVLGSLFLAWAPSPVVKKVLGMTALGYVVIQLTRMRAQGSKGVSGMPAWAGSLLGLVAGIFTAIAHSGGIISSIYLLGVGLPKNVFIATLVVTFFLGNLVKFPLYWETNILTAPMLLTGLALTPAMLLGGRLGMALNRRVSVEQFTFVVIAVVGLSGAVLTLT